jgi:HpcH/HpaI aldolase/citrate lyase family
MSLTLMLLTNDCKFATTAQSAGVDRIFVDLEYLNKRERQRSRNTVISDHTLNDVRMMRNVLTTSELLVRTNPINPSLKNEVRQVIRNGADVLMLPMVVEADDVKEYVDYVGGRARVSIMIETTQAFARIHSILSVKGVDEVFIGLNDLHIGFGLTFMFELLSGGIIDYAADLLNERAIPFGFGGIAKIGEGLLPAEYIIGEHYRLGSCSVILSRTFRNDPSVRDNSSDSDIDIHKEVAKIRKRESEIASWTPDDFEENRKLVFSKTSEVISMLESKWRTRVC